VRPEEPGSGAVTVPDPGVDLPANTLASAEKCAAACRAALRDRRRDRIRVVYGAFEVVSERHWKLFDFQLREA